MISLRVGMPGFKYGRESLSSSRPDPCSEVLWQVLYMCYLTWFSKLRSRDF